MKENNTLNWALLVTGWGRGATKVINSFNNGYLGNNIIKLLIYENLPCGAANEAIKSNIKSLNIKRSDFNSTAIYQHKLTQILKEENIDYIFLLNYKYRIRTEMLEAFKNRIINIHPSLLPSFKNTSKAIQEALAYGVKVSGITTHIIDENMDEGTIISQEPIVFEEWDDFESIDSKFTKAGEQIAVKTINLINSQHYNKVYQNV